MAIRAMTPQDIPAVFDLYNQTKLDELAFEPTSFSLIPLAQDTARRQALLESDVYVFAEDTILGVGAIKHHEIRALFVSAAARKQGIAKQLLHKMLATALGPVTLTVVASNAPAKLLYQQFGFVEHRNTLAVYNEQTVRVIEMLLANANANANA